MLRLHRSNAAPRWKLILEGQWLHLALLAPSVAGLAVAGTAEGMRAGTYEGIAAPAWYWIAITLPIVHQVYVWFCWRTQLHGGLLTKVLGQRAFPAYAIAFAIIGISRVAVVFPVAISNRDTLGADTAVLRILAVSALVPWLYLVYSVGRYFGFRRATGQDHFDEAYRAKPFVRKGIFRFTRNGMYTCGFLIFWIPGLWYSSNAALLVAAFNHAYIWVHYFATERPDMRQIYGDERVAARGAAG